VGTFAFSTPLIPGLEGGAAAYGFLDIDARDLLDASVFTSGPSDRQFAIIRVDGALPGMFGELEDADLLLIVNLTDRTFADPKLGIGQAGFRTDLLQGGIAHDPRFGGSGTVTVGTDIIEASEVHEFGAYRVYATVIQDDDYLPGDDAFGDVPKNFFFSAERDGIEYFARPEIIDDGQVVYVREPGLRGNVDQTQDPSGLTLDGTTWQSLGGTIIVGPGGVDDRTIEVSISSATAGIIAADGVMLRRVDAPTFPNLRVLDVTGNPLNNRTHDIYLPELAIEVDVAADPDRQPVVGVLAPRGDTPNAIDLDSAIEQVSIADIAALDLARNLTLEAWIKPEAFTNQWSPIVYKGAGTDALARNYTLWLNNAGFLHFTTSDGTAQYAVNSPIGSIKLGEWYHVAGVIDRDTGSMRLYLNGQIVGTGSVSTADAVTSNQALRIGGTQESSGGYSNFNGQIDEVRLWNVARTGVEIRSEMAAEIPQMPGLVGHWKFDELSGALAVDSSATGRNGSLIGAVSRVQAPVHVAAFDPDGDPLSVTVVSDTAGITASVVGRDITIGGSGSGTARISVVVSDENGALGDGRGRATDAWFDYTQGANAIYGTKFDDINGNGVRDAGEQALDGVQVFLDLNGNGGLDAGEPVVYTDIHGDYAFRDVASLPVGEPAAVNAVSLVAPNGGAFVTVVNDVINLPGGAPIIIGTTTTTRTVRLDVRINGFSYGGITLRPADVAGNATRADLAADLNRLLDAQSIPVGVSVNADGTLRFSDEVGGGRATTLSLTATTETSVVSESIFGGSSASSSVSQGGLGLPGGAQVDAGADAPLTVVEVPFAGWRPTLGGEVLPTGLLGTRTVRFTADGEISTDNDFGNQHLVDIAVTGPSTVVEGVPAEFTATLTDPSTGEAFARPLDIVWIVQDASGEVVWIDLGATLRFASTDQGSYRVLVGPTFPRDFDFEGDEDRIRGRRGLRVRDRRARPGARCHAFEPGADQRDRPAIPVHCDAVRVRRDGDQQRPVGRCRRGSRGGRGRRDLAGVGTRDRRGRCRRPHDRRAVGRRRVGELGRRTGGRHRGGTRRIDACVCRQRQLRGAAHGDRRRRGTGGGQLHRRGGQRGAGGGGGRRHHARDGERLFLGRRFEALARTTAVENGRVFDPGRADKLRATVDWGDGTVERVRLLEQGSDEGGLTMWLDASRVYDKPGRYEVRVTVEDDDGGVGEDRFVVDVVNVPVQLGPLPDAVSLDEGGFVSLGALDIRFFDRSPNAEYVVTVDWGDGTATTESWEAEFVRDAFAGGQILGEHRYDENGEYRITITVNDGEFEASGSILAVVANVAPVFREMDLPEAFEGERIELAFAFDDPGALDTFVASGTWGDGTEIADAEILVDAGQGIVRVAHTYAARGTFGFKLVLGDDDGGEDAVSFDLRVRNAAPVIALPPEGSAREGDLIELKVLVTDTGAGDLDKAEVSIDWGDTAQFPNDAANEAPAMLVEENGSHYVVASHRYADDGVYRITLSVTDAEGAWSIARQTITVANVAPTIALSGPARILDGQTFRLTGVVTDPGADVVKGWKIDWDDGGEPQSFEAGANAVFSHVYKGITEPRIAKIVATVMDEDGEWTSSVFELQLAPDLLSVASIDGEASGFHVRFDREIDVEALNLYASPDTGTGRGDVVFRRASGAVVAGSLFADADNQGFRFVATGGALEGGKYTVSLRGGAGGLADRRGGALDGNEDGIAGDDYVGGVTIDTRESIVFSLPDFVRGANQSVLVPNAAGRGQGLPLRVLRPEGVQAFTLAVDFDTRMLDVRGARLADGLKGEVILEPTKDGLELRVFLSEPLRATDTMPVWLDAVVPENVPTGPGQILDLRVLSVLSASSRSFSPRPTTLCRSPASSETRRATARTPCSTCSVCNGCSPGSTRASARSRTSIRRSSATSMRAAASRRSTSRGFSSTCSGPCVPRFRRCRGAASPSASSATTSGRRPWTGMCLRSRAVP
jgi:hypothetical protein